MNNLTSSELSLELLCWHDSALIGSALGITSAEVIKWSKGEVIPREENELKLRKLFEEHVKSNSTHLQIKDLNEHVGSTVLVNTPDGFQTIKRFVVKGDRICKQVTTQAGKKLTASIDHLTEAEFGWVKHGTLSIDDVLVTSSGLDKVVDVVNVGSHQTYDVEVNHPQHRYWAEGISSHNSGKSFLLSNIMKGAQSDGAFILAIDTENALDHEYLARIGVDSSPDHFMGIAVVTISDVVSVVSDFIKMYEKEYGKYNDAAPKVLIAIDSLDMLLTDSENEHFNSGVQKGDQGQRAKQMKAFLRTTVSRIKALNIAFIGTHQVYPADVLQGEGKWAINNAIRYSASQIVLITKLRLKQEGEISGIRMYVETFKSRFAKLGSKVEVSVPYDTGMNPYSGLLELLETDGVVTKSGAWWQCKFPSEEKPFSFQSTKLDKVLAERLLSHPSVVSNSRKFEDVLRTPETPVELGEAEPNEGFMGGAIE